MGAVLQFPTQPAASNDEEANDIPAEEWLPLSFVGSVGAFVLEIVGIERPNASWIGIRLQVGDQPPRIRASTKLIPGIEDQQASGTNTHAQLALLMLQIASENPPLLSDPAPPASA